VEGCTFKYESTDPFLCQLFLVTSAHQMDQSIAIWLRLVEKKEARMRKGFASALMSIRRKVRLYVSDVLLMVGRC
jgi:hypothetical protein